MTHAPTSSASIHDGPTDSPTVARRWIRGLLEARDVDPVLVDDASLLVSELVTNAMVHAGGARGLRATFADGVLTLSVTDRSRITPAPRLFSPTDSSGGLGLQIIDQLSSTWGVERKPGGKTVWATLRLPS